MIVKKKEKCGWFYILIGFRIQSKTSQFARTEVKIRSGISQNHRIFLVGSAPQGWLSPTLRWRAHKGINPQIICIFFYFLPLWSPKNLAYEWRGSTSFINMCLSNNLILVYSKSYHSNQSRQNPHMVAFSSFHVFKSKFYNLLQILYRKEGRKRKEVRPNAKMTW